MGTSKSTWIASVLLVIVLPATLFGIWSWLVFGGSIERLRESERKAAREALAFVSEDVRQALEGRPDRIDTSSGRVWLRVDERGRLDPDPCALPLRSPSKARELDSTWRAGIRLEVRGEERARPFLEHALSHAVGPPPVEGLLALARCRAGAGEVTGALALLERAARSQEHEERWTATGFPEALLLRLGAARIASNDGDTSRAESLLKELASCAVGVPLAVQESVLQRLVRWTKKSEPAWVPFHREFLNVIGELRAGRAPRSRGTLIAVRPAENTWLLCDRGHVQRVMQDGMKVLEERYPDYQQSTAADAVWSEEVPWIGRAVHLETREPRESGRLQTLAGRLLLAAFFAFALGNVLVLRSIRQERRLARMRSSFVDLVSHELRTPLTALSLRTEMLARGEVPREKLAQYGERIHGDVRRLSSLTARILDFARLEKGRLPLDCAPVNVRALLARALGEVRDSIRLGNKRVHIDLPRDEFSDVSVHVDVDVTTRALTNVIENASKHATCSEFIGVSGSVEPSHVCLHIEDAGPGIEAHEREALFRPFQRGKNARGKPGSGLGLSFVRQALRAHGGEVTVADSTHGGCRFTLKWPRGKTSREGQS